MRVGGHLVLLHTKERYLLFHHRRLFFEHFGGGGTLFHQRGILLRHLIDAIERLVNFLDAC